MYYNNNNNYMGNGQMTNNNVPFSNQPSSSNPMYQQRPTEWSSQQNPAYFPSYSNANVSGDSWTRSRNDSWVQNKPETSANWRTTMPNDSWLNNAPSPQSNQLFNRQNFPSPAPPRYGQYNGKRSYPGNNQRNQKNGPTTKKPFINKKVKPVEESCSDDVTKLTKEQLEEKVKLQLQMMEQQNSTEKIDEKPDIKEEKRTNNKRPAPVDEHEQDEYDDEVSEEQSEQEVKEKEGQVSKPIPKVVTTVSFDDIHFGHLKKRQNMNGIKSGQKPVKNESWYNQYKKNVDNMKNSVLSPSSSSSPNPALSPRYRHDSSFFFNDFKPTNPFGVVSNGPIYRPPLLNEVKKPPQAHLPPPALVPDSFIRTQRSVESSPRKGALLGSYNGPINVQKQETMYQGPSALTMGQAQFNFKQEQSDSDDDDDGAIAELQQLLAQRNKMYTPNK